MPFSNNLVVEDRLISNRGKGRSIISISKRESFVANMIFKATMGLPLTMMLIRSAAVVPATYAVVAVMATTMTI